jgi:peptidoglycan/LPS O-acetylase OafA/YrhL
MKYIKQLDSVRALAVSLVIISHWISSDSIINFIPNGLIGVDIFFVLSGFLITRILMENRKSLEATDNYPSSILKNFYARRVLRIFPVYYIFIFLLLIFRKHVAAHVDAAFPYLITYTSNYYFFKLKGYDGVLSPLWSLSVEEQFYLLWPWIIVFVRQRFLLRAIVIFILFGIATQYLFLPYIMSDILTTSCFDAFGLGALLAWQITYQPQRLPTFYKWSAIAALLSFIVGVPMLINRHLVILPSRTLISIVALWLITYVVYRHNSDKLRMKWLFNNSRVILLGKISYGVYLFHLMIPKLTDAIAYRLFSIHTEDVRSPKWLLLMILVINFIFLFIVSWLSWTFIEQPFLRLKKYFGYRTVRTKKDDAEN